MVWWCLGCFEVFGVGLGYFEAVGFQKRNLAHYMYGDALVGFGIDWFPTLIKLHFRYAYYVW